jgi:hypothetical protein
MRRALLALLIASIVLNAALGIYALVGGAFGDLEQNVLFTSLSISAAGALGLACLPALERRRLWPLPVAGMAAAAAACAAVLAVIWLADPPQTLERIAWTLAVAAVAATWGSIVGLARLARRFRWVIAGAVGLAVLLAVLVAVAIWGAGDVDWYGRTIGVVAVLLAAFTLLVPVLHRASRRELVPAEGVGGALRFCPRCGGALTVAPDEESTCPACGLRFTVHVRRAAA